MKKRIVTAAITACLALCAAVWPQPDTREERPAPIPTHAAAAPKADVVTTAEKKNTETPRAEPDEELGAVPVPAPAEPTPAVETPQLEPAPPTPQPTIELQPGDEAYIPGTIRWRESPRVCRGYVRKWQQNREYGLKQDMLGAGILLDHESCCTEKWLVS